MEELMLKIENVKKEYKLGQIGGTTLRDELQRLKAKILKREDPTKRIGAKNYNQGEKFLALDGVSFEVKKGERIGIIGHNGAGKSTLLKLISRITAPTEGAIYLNGRVASMLEVGTGFNPELTGRENIYVNGAILGMTKKEIDAKMEDIIEFSEVRQFIDTPVKRYSSGMYVKLAFSVAAHLDSEIMIMDEVLAVGDMAFQKKCLDKMSDVSKEQGRTILYVSHNMNTIRQLCNRVIVLDHGKVVFDGDVEEGIGIYMAVRGRSPNVVDLTAIKRTHLFSDHTVTMKQLIVDTQDGVFEVGNKINGQLVIVSSKDYNNIYLRIPLRTASGQSIARYSSHDTFNIKKDEEFILNFEIDISMIAPGRYTLNPILSLQNNMGGKQFLDGINEAYVFEIVPYLGFNFGEIWDAQYSGNLVPPYIKLRK